MWVKGRYDLVNPFTVHSIVGCVSEVSSGTLWLSITSPGECVEIAKY